jgi:hypothetical protein
VVRATAAAWLWAFDVNQVRVEGSLVKKTLIRGPKKLSNALVLSLDGADARVRTTQVEIKGVGK